MSDSISDDDDDLNQLLSYDPFSTERPAATNSDDNCIVEEALDEEEQKKDLGDASIDGIGACVEWMHTFVLVQSVVLCPPVM